MRRLALLSVTFLCLAASPGLALSDKPYITAADIDFPALLPPPPTENSAAGKLDLQTIVDLQKGLTPERDKQIHADLDQSVYQIAGPVLWTNVTKTNFPLTGAFIGKVDRGCPWLARDGLRVADQIVDMAGLGPCRRIGRAGGDPRGAVRRRPGLLAGVGR
jgi:hypothetical protein